MTRPEPGRLGSLRRPPRRESTEVDEPAERWIIDDLEPLHHEEQTLR
ncbi:hypothetical protein [Paraliomyxa miuraensis]|nr:hypothetical protein [Paraliomyxa miuraensis]MCX4247610.1 hypothetical protein [Paraliomyxa miuraensis]